MMFAKVLIFPDIFKNVDGIVDYRYLAAKTLDIRIDWIMVTNYKIKSSFENICWARKLESWAFERMQLESLFKCANFNFYFS